MSDDRPTTDSGGPTTNDDRPIADGGFVPAQPANDWVGDWSRRRARLSPDAVGLVDATTGRELTYRALDARANRVARALRELDVGHGDRVAVVSRNRPALVDLFFATGKLGAVLAPVSHRLAPPTLAELLGDIEPTVLLVETEFSDLAGDALAATELDPPTLAVDDPAHAGSDDGTHNETGNYGGERANETTSDTTTSETTSDTTTSETTSDTTTSETTTADTTSDGTIDGRWEAVVPADDTPIDRPEVAMDDPHLLLHTGGSTGTPKETIVSHRSILWNSFNTITAWGLRPEDTTPMTFPMFHTGGWNVLTVPLFHLGGTVVIAREVDPGRLLRLVEERSATVVIAVPAVLQATVDHDRWAETDLSSLRFAKSGGGPARSGTIEAWWDRGVELSQGYGLTECGPNNFAMPDNWDRAKTDGVGVPAMHVDARVVDENGEPLPQGEIGELELSGPHAATGYWRRPDASRETFGKGWVSTGDLARVDSDGYYTIEGRKKNMFTSGGENVYPPAVENAITDHPAVREAVVIGVPDEQWGTVGKAVIEGDESLTLAELREFLDGRLARFKHPHELAFVEEMPTAGPSKIDRTAIEREFGEE